MNARRSCALLVPALVAGALALPAAGSPPAPAPTPATVPATGGGAVGVTLAVLPDGGRVDTGTVQGALTSVRRHADIRSWLTSIATAVRAAQGPSGAPAPIVIATAEDGAPESGPIEVLPDFTVAGSGGDLDGDGLDDVVAAHGDDEDLTLQARRGADGALLWSVGLADGVGALAYPLGTDVTGDGVDDLLSHVLTGMTEVFIGEGSSEYTYRYASTFTHSIAVHSGIDGRQLWNRRIEGSIEESASGRNGPAGLTYDGEYSLQATGLGILPLLTTDVTGDGLDDVVLNEIDLDIERSGEGAGVFVIGTDSSREALRSSTRVVLLAGRDGTEFLRREAVDQAGIAVAVPAGQVVGSGAGDLAWSTQLAPDLESTCAQVVFVECLEEPSGRRGIDVELVDGATGQVAWAISTEGVSPTMTPLDTDLDGDGTRDLALTVGDADGSRLLVLSGARGRTLWQVTGEYPLLLGIGPDAGGRQVAAVADLSTAYSYDPLTGSTVTAKTALQRRDAMTGELLSTRDQQVSARAAEDGTHIGDLFAWAVSPAQDGDGDGRQELVLAVTVEVRGFDDDGAQMSRDASSSLRVEDLGAGRLLLEEATDDVRLLFPLGDLDGDGLLDLERDVIDEGDIFAPSAVTAFRATDGVELWSHRGGLATTLHAVGDQDGEPGLEVVQVVREGADAPLVASLRGADLRERWRAPARERP